MYGICAVVSHLTKSGVRCESTCSNEGGCQIVVPVLTGNVTGFTNRIGWTEIFPESLFPVGMEGFDVC